MYWLIPCCNFYVLCLNTCYWYSFHYFLTGILKEKRGTVHYEKMTLLVLWLADTFLKVLLLILLRHKLLCAKNTVIADIFVFVEGNMNGKC